MPHRVVIDTTQPQRARAVCECSWTSPWATAGPAQPDLPPRTDYQDRALRAAQWHVRNPGEAR
jgi:hypothetical protein